LTYASNHFRQQLFTVEVRLRGEDVDEIDCFIVTFD